MASVINSARTSTASVFDVVTNAANATNQLVTAASKSIDMLDAKATLMHQRVITNVRAQQVIVVDHEITKAATEHTDLMEDIHKRNYPNQPFDRQKFFESALQKITDAVHNPS